MAGQPLRSKALKALPWVGAIYRFDRDHYAMKLRDHHAVVVKFEDVMRLLYNPLVDDTEPGAPAPDESGR